MPTVPNPDSPALSLCMIVRDEEELLPRFLAQAAGTWDELVAVDTGSRDGTRKLLERAGARVIDRPWTGDFSAARNVGLAAARGRWILFLDADEMASPALAPALRALTADPHAGAATLVMQNPLPHGHQRETRLLRLFRNDPAIRFKHRIHEEVASAVAAHLRRTGLEMRHLPASVLHLGYVRERAAARNKKDRDVELLRQSVEENAHDFYSWFKLMEVARFWDDRVLADGAARECLVVLESAGSAALEDQPFGGELLAMLASARFPERPAAAAALLEAWEPHLVESAAFHLRHGELCERAGRSADAAESFGRCLALANETTDIQLATVRPLMGLARLALGRRTPNLEQAWTFTERALAYNPRDPEALLAAATICQSAGGRPLLDQFTAGYVEKHGRTDELQAALLEMGGARPAQLGAR